MQLMVDNLLLALSHQQFCQDWLCNTSKKSKQTKWGTCVVELPSIKMNVSLRHFDESGVLHEKSIWDSSTGDDVVSDEMGSFSEPHQIVQVIEACIRSVTTQCHKLLHTYLHNAFRSRLWSEEFGSNSEEMSFSQIFSTINNASTGDSIEELMVHHNDLLPIRRSKLHTRIIQKEFVEGLWTAGLLSKLPQICECAISLAIRATNFDMDARHKEIERDTMRSLLSLSASPFPRRRLAHRS